MSNSIASDMTPAILRGGRFTSLLAFDLPWICPLALHRSQDRALVVAEIDPKCDQLFRIWDIAHGFDCANSNVDLIQKFGRNCGLHFGNCHSAILLGMRQTKSGGENEIRV